MSRYDLLVCGALLTMAFLASAGAVRAAPDTCDFQAYSGDPDPAGTNVRSGPGTGFDVVGVLLPDIADGDVWSPEFRVTGFEDGWFRIGDAIAGRYGDGPEVRVFRGPGWVSAKLVPFSVEDTALRDAPSWDAPVILDMGTDGSWDVDALQVQAVHGCHGGFLDVTLANGTGETRRGWVTNICGNQATTCSMGNQRPDPDAD